MLLAALLVAFLAFAPRAEAFVYWTNSETGTIGRAELDGTGVDQSFITGASFPIGVAVDGGHVYWGNFSEPVAPGTGPGQPGDQTTIGRSNLDGTGVEQSFITGANSPTGLAVDATHIYWASFSTTGGNAIGRANLDGTGVDRSFIIAASAPGGVAVDGSHVYWTNYSSGTIARANLDGTGVEQSFITGANFPAGLAVDAAHIYWVNEVPGTIGRANLDGTGADQSFISVVHSDTIGVAVHAFHLYWANGRPNAPIRDTIGRANLDGTGVDQSFITGASAPWGVTVDALTGPSNAFRLTRVKKNKRKGTAKLTVNVPGPGELDLAKTHRVKPGDETADAAGKEKLVVESRRRARKKLNADGKAKVNPKVTYTPDGGEPNTEREKIKLVKR